MFALIHFPSTKVCKKNKVLKKSAIKVLRGNDRWKNTQECLFYRKRLFFSFVHYLKVVAIQIFKNLPTQSPTRTKYTPAGKPETSILSRSDIPV